MDIFLHFCTSGKQRLCICSEYVFKNVCLANNFGESDSVCEGRVRTDLITDLKERQYIFDAKDIHA